MSTSPHRYEKLARLLPNAKSAKQAIIEAGFSPKTAEKQQRRVVASALKHTARGILNGNDTEGKTGRELMSDLVGLSRETLMELLVKIATQDKDYGSALKVIAPLVRQHNVILAEESQKTIVPIINIGGTERNNGLVEPDVAQGSQKSYSATQEIGLIEGDEGGGDATIVEENTP